MIRILARLFRVRLSLLNGTAAAGGYLLFPSGTDIRVLCLAFSGVVLMAAGSSALNQVMEHELDRLMTRTKMRPLPNGDLTNAAAIRIGSGVSLCGLLLLGCIGRTLPLLLGLAAFTGYLAIYTPLKRHTTLSLAIGALCGAIPPVIGWSMAGGDASDYRIVLPATLMYIWQIPHCCLLQRRYAEDYRNADIPLVDDLCKKGLSGGLTGLWVFALITGGMLLPTFGIVHGHMAFVYALYLLPLFLIKSIRTIP